jgi:hypothetical protein
MSEIVPRPADPRTTLTYIRSRGRLFAGRMRCRQPGHQSSEKSGFVMTTALAMSTPAGPDCKDTPRSTAVRRSQS